MALPEPEAKHSRSTLVFLGTLLCLLLALFAIERRVAAYPAHNIAARATAATGVEKPEHIGLAAPQSLELPAFLYCVVALFAACCNRRVSGLVPPPEGEAFSHWVPTPLAVRPPPAL